MENKKIPLLTRRLALNLFIEFGPILAFFVAFNFFDFIRATVVLVVVVVVAFLASIFIEKRVAIFSLFASGSILVFGLATVFLHNPDYIIFKDTLFWGIFGMIIGGYYLRGTLMQFMLSRRERNPGANAWGMRV